jgi:serine/threonine protein kinase
LIYGKTYQGIIHRDLKPANIMVSSRGDLKLMDFGIARPAEASLHTVEGNIVGTMQYLSPEQLDGVDVDSRADIYSFGAILYEMLTGTKTFPQETITNLMKQKITNEYRKFTDFDFSIPVSLAKIAQKCLQLSKESRFASAVILLKELENVHRSLTSETPENILKSFINNPSSIKTDDQGKSSVRKIMKITIPAVVTLIIGTFIAIFLMTGPKETIAPQPPPTVKTTTTVIAPSAQPPQTSWPATALQQTGKETLHPFSPDNISVNTMSARQTESISNRQQDLRTHRRAQRPEPALSTENKIAPQPNKPDVSPIEKLKSAYGTGDYLAIGKLAMQKSAFNDAILSLTALPKSDPNHEKASLMLMNAYIEAGRLQDAQSLAQSQTVNDAEYFFLCGKLAQKQGKSKDALALFQTALTKPSAGRALGEVRMDALYYIALANQVLYVGDPSPDNKGMALQAWLVVKNAYRNTPNHPRFKKAVEEMASIK